MPNSTNHISYGLLLMNTSATFLYTYYVIIWFNLAKDNRKLLVLKNKYLFHDIPHNLIIRPFDATTAVTNAVLLKSVEKKLRE
jgi:hypothetical protein